MNRNISMAESMIWHTKSDADVTVASFVDNGTVPHSDLEACLSLPEKKHAAGLSDATEIRHYIARRSFQRLFLCKVLNLALAPRELSLIHQLDRQPSCLDAPGLSFSFSSSGTTAVACASTKGVVGIDIERSREVENVIALAQRHFTLAEAQALAQLPKAMQSPTFLRYWTAKEAGLKAIGQGIIFGLNTFTVSQNEVFSYSMRGPSPAGLEFSLTYPEILPGHVVALVQKNSAEKADSHL